MADKELMLRNDTLRVPTGRDIAGILFRHKRAFVVCFLVVLGLGILKAFTMARYQAEMQVLVRHGRVDAMASPMNAATPDMNPITPISEQDVNSQVELLHSDDLLRQVVLALHLEDTEHARFASGNEAQQIKIAKAVRRLAKHLTVKPVQKTNLLTVSYRAKDPQKAQEVLEKLSQVYLQKHMELHRPSGQFGFFDQQAKKFKQELDENHQQLLALVDDPTGSVAPAAERDLSLAKSNEFLARMNEDNAAIQDAQMRLAKLEAQRNTIHPRITTATKEADNPELLEVMKSTLLNLELKHSEMIAKYDSNYRPVKDLEQQIAQTKAAIAAQKTAPVMERTTDQNPVYGWVDGQIAQVRTELAGLRAKRDADRQITSSYDTRTRSLAAAAITRSDLLRNEKMLEANYSLYVQKREEARISDALDQDRIGNVAIAEAPVAPALPTWPLPLLLILSFVGALGLGALAAFLADWLDPSFRTPDELALVLGVPVLAYFPRQPGGGAYFAEVQPARNYLPRKVTDRQQQ